MTETGLKISKALKGNKNAFGYRHPIEKRKSMGAQNIGRFTGNKSVRFKPWSQLTYGGKHIRIKVMWGNACKCESDTCTGKSTKYDWANLSGEYKEDRQDWKMLCHSCHFLHDRHKFNWPVNGRVKVVQKNKNGVIINEYESIKAAHKATGVSKSGISNVLINRAKTAGGFIWYRS